MSTVTLGDLLRSVGSEYWAPELHNTPSMPSRTEFDIKFVENSDPKKVRTIDRITAIILLRALIDCSLSDAESLLDQNIHQMSVDENGDPAATDLGDDPKHILPSKRK